MLTTRQLAWAAGFLEGEGSFGFHSNCIRVVAVQVQREPLERLQAMFGGSIGMRNRKLSHGIEKKRPLHVWQIYGQRAAEVTMTMLCMLSPRRTEQAIKALAGWKAQPGAGAHNKNKTHCARGHEFTPENTYTYKPPRGVQGRVCRVCSRENSRKSDAKRRAGGD